MRLLVDTHLLLWAAYAPERLPAEAAALIADEVNTPSAASLWEVAIPVADPAPVGEGLSLRIDAFDPRRCGVLRPRRHRCAPRPALMDDVRASCSSAAAGLATAYQASSRRGTSEGLPACGAQREARGAGRPSRSPRAKGCDSSPLHGRSSAATSRGGPRARRAFSAGGASAGGSGLSSRATGGSGRTSDGLQKSDGIAEAVRSGFRRPSPIRAMRRRRGCHPRPESANQGANCHRIGVNSHEGRWLSAWYRLPGSNGRPPDPQSGALTS